MPTGSLTALSAGVLGETIIATLSSAGRIGSGFSVLISTVNLSTGVTVSFALPNLAMLLQVKAPLVIRLMEKATASALKSVPS